VLAELRKAGPGIVRRMRGGNLPSQLDLLHAEAIAEPLPLTLECDDLDTWMRLALQSNLLAVLPHQLASTAGRSLRRIETGSATAALIAEIHAFCPMAERYLPYPGALAASAAHAAASPHAEVEGEFTAEDGVCAGPTAAASTERQRESAQ
jgi:hypothetical protein